MAKETKEKSSGTELIRVKALQTCYYDDGLRMPGSVFDIRGEKDFNPKAMKKVGTSVRRTNTPVSSELNNKHIPPGPALTEAEQDLEDERLEAEKLPANPDESVI